VIASLLGGLGLFLLGMVLLTDGLKAAAGDALRDLLGRLTGGALPAFLSGAALTAMVQSSSATTVATIGFVSAGLLAFTPAVGVILGAAVGTTSTGWLVAFLGLKFSISALALPLVGVGAFLRLLGRGRRADVGLAIAGFGLIFVGIDTLQAGMLTLAERFHLGELPYGELHQRLLLVLIGAGMTVVMQSSSAAVATTLSAVHAGTLALAPAAILVVGASIGTTVTAALASVGAPVPARRTALAHIVFNLFAGVLAFTLLPLALPLLEAVAGRRAAGPEGAIAVFHTAFTLAGAAIVLPFAGRYALLIGRLVPDRTPRLTRNLSASSLAVPAVAVEAARRTSREIAAVLLERMRDRLRGAPARRDGGAPPEAAAALAETARFLGDVHTADGGDVYGRHVSVLHALDHLERLADALEQAEPARVVPTDADARRLAAELEQRLAGPIAWLRGEGGGEGEDDGAAGELERASLAIADLRRGSRPRLMERTAGGELEPDEALRRLDALRWLDRLAYHAWRATHHLGRQPPPPAGPGAAPVPPEP
jgi:phosphate:Na+ symporter